MRIAGAEPALDGAFGLRPQAKGLPPETWLQVLLDHVFFGERGSQRVQWFSAEVVVVSLRRPQGQGFQPVLRHRAGASHALPRWHLKKWACLLEKPHGGMSLISTSLP